MNEVKLKDVETFIITKIQNEIFDKTDSHMGMPLLSQGKILGWSEILHYVRNSIKQGDESIKQ